MAAGTALTPSTKRRRADWVYLPNAHTIAPRWLMTEREPVDIANLDRYGNGTSTPFGH